MTAGTAHTLQAALTHLRVHGWTQGRMRRDGAVCAAEAIRAVTPNRSDRRVSDEERAALTALAQHITPPPTDEPDELIGDSAMFQVTAWNDACTSMAEVEDGFRRAITALEQP
ncbi:DUF6197 family protein [Streptomyces olivaceiscleroticus]|uniref:Uncharacterized protein n=1 Tax=Streptomyces olivaceiscleroticus TaxID=68245 RepID=A0ABN1BP30_9ACTN